MMKLGSICCYTDKCITFMMTGCDGKDYPECKYKKELIERESNGILKGVDCASNGDYGCEITFKADKNKKFHMLKVKYFPPKEANDVQK